MRDYLRDLRLRIGTTKIIVPGVRAIIRNAAGELLLERQRLFDSWALPHGCVDLEESALEAVVRETREETGIEIVTADLFGVYTDPKYSITYPNGDEVQTFTVAFLVREWRGSPHADGIEVREVAFFPLDRLPVPIYSVHADTIDDLKSFNGQPIMR